MKHDGVRGEVTSIHLYSKDAKMSFDVAGEKLTGDSALQGGGRWSVGESNTKDVETVRL